MSALDEVREKLGTKEGQEELINWIEQYNKKLAKNDMITKDIVSNDTYMRWLEEFTNEFESFSDDSWLYCKEEISEKNHEMVRMLSNLFEAVDSFAEMNYIPSKKVDFGYSYDISFNDNVYEIGFLQGQGTVFFVNRLKEKEKANPISFEDIKRGEKTERAKKIDSIFSKMDNIIVELHKENVTDDMLVRHVNNVLIKKYEN